MPKLTSYRERIFAEYAPMFQDATPLFDPAAAARWSKAYDYYLRGWLPHRKDAHILDVACGGGKLLYFLQTRGYTRTSGVDRSPSQIRLARQVLPDAIEANILDILKTSLGAFDLIIGLDIVEHLQKDEVLPFLDGCFAALKPGGRLILQTPNADSPWGTMHRYNDFTHEVCFNPNALSRLMRLCGFVQIEARETGPAPFSHGARSTTRYIAWQTIRLGLKLWNLAETGDPGAGILTRVFLITGKRA